jgi:hypothetical protein
MKKRSDENDTIFNRRFSNTCETISSFSHMNIIDKIRERLNGIKAGPQRLQKFVSTSSATGSHNQL